MERKIKMIIPEDRVLVQYASEDDHDGHIYSILKSDFDCITGHMMDAMKKPDPEWPDAVNSILNRCLTLENQIKVDRFICTVADCWGVGENNKAWGKERENPGI